jgi:hypothetical protein
MAYTPPVTFSNGSTVNAADVKASFDDLQAYVNGGASVGDYKTISAWAGQQHFVRPRYNGVTNTWQGVTGAATQATRGLETGRYTYANRPTSQRVDGSVEWQWIPGTVKQLVVPRSARAILLQFSFSARVYGDGTVNSGAGYGSPFVHVRGFLTGGSPRDVSDLQGLADLDPLTEHQLQIEVAGSYFSSPKQRRDHQSGYKLVENKPAGVYTVGLAQQSNVPRVRIWRWSVTAEAWMV